MAQKAWLTKERALLARVFDSHDDLNDLRAALRDAGYSFIPLEVLHLEAHCDWGREVVERLRNVRYSAWFAQRDRSGTYLVRVGGTPVLLDGNRRTYGGEWHPAGEFKFPRTRITEAWQLVLL
jgi:hypothetical protein